MKRTLLFLALLLAFTLLRFPHRRFVEGLLAPPIGRLGLALSVAEVGYAFPFGYRLERVRISRPGGTLSLVSVSVQPSIRRGMVVSVKGCGGSIAGSLGSQRVALEFSDLDPAECIESGSIRLQGRFSGALQLDNPGTGREGGPIGSVATKGRLELRIPSGSISGTIQMGGRGTGFVLGEWKYRDASAKARISDGEILVPEADVFSQGIEWRLSKGRIFTVAPGAIRLAAEIRARATGGSARAKAVFALLPKTGAGPDGWRHYRIGGSLQAPTLIGLP